MKEEKTQEVKQSEVAPAPKKDTAKMVWMIIAIIAIIALIGSIAYGYMSMKNLNKKISDQQSQINDLQNTKKTLEDAASAAATAATNAAAKAVGNAISGQTEEQQIKTAAINYMEAMDGQKNGKTFQIDSYKTNGNFTTVSIGFLSNGQRTTGEALILKKVNGSWVAVYAGQNLQPEVQKEFGIPNN